MKKRLIDPEIFSDDRLASCGHAGLTLYMGLICSCDVLGRLEDRPLKIKAKIFPYFPEIDVDQVLNLLAKVGIINRYSVGEIRIIQIVNFSKGMSFNGEKSYGLPDPDSCIPAGTELVEAGNQLNTNTNTNTNKKGECEGEKLPREPKPKLKNPDLKNLELPKNLEPIRSEVESWVSYKVEKGKPYKPLGLKALLSELSKFDAETVRSAIQKSMSSNWDGLFPEKISTRGGGGLFNSAMQTQSLIDRVIEEEEAKFHG